MPTPEDKKSDRDDSQDDNSVNSQKLAAFSALEGELDLMPADLPPGQFPPIHRHQSQVIVPLDEVSSQVPDPSGESGWSFSTRDKSAKDTFPSALDSASHDGTENPLDFRETIIKGSAAAQEAMSEDSPTQAFSPDAQGTANRFEVGEEIARGGVGRISRGFDPRVLREVAFKELLPKAIQTEGAMERFVREAQVTGQLEHPGIVPVYDFGWEADGRPYYCMRLLNGRTMHETIVECFALKPESAERRMAFRKLLKHFVDVCEAVAYAHDRGVVHRDLKPANVMIGDFGETLVLDWGMAKILTVPGSENAATVTSTANVSEQTLIEVPDAERTEHVSADNLPAPSSSASVSRRSVSGVRSSRMTSVNIDRNVSSTDTQMGSILGTLAYMPPEQVLGMTDEIDARTDVYALGAILYEILTREPPIPKAPVKVRILHIVNGQIRPPRALNRQVPRAIEAICLKALARSKVKRYAGALLIAQDVEAWLADEPVSAWSEPLYVTAGRFIRRHRAGFVTTASVLMVLLLSLGAWRWWDARRVELVRQSATRESDLASDAIKKGDHSAAFAMLQRASALLSAEPALAKSGLSQRINDLDSLRVAGLQRQVETQLAAVDKAEQAGEMAQAQKLLTEAAALAAGDTSLAAIKKSIEQRQSRLQAHLRAGEQSRQEHARLEKFQSEVDQSRFLLSLIRGERADQDLVEAAQHAGVALQLYPFDKPPLTKPASLTDADWNSVLDDALELHLMAADTTVRLGAHKPPEERTAAIREGLRWLAQGRRLQRPCRILEFRAAEYERQLGNTAEADRLAALGSTIPSQSAFDFFLAAESERNAGRFDQAINLYQETLRRNPKHYWATQFLAVCHYHKEDFAAAVANLTACIAARPEFAWTYAVRGVALARLRQFDQALEDFQSAEKIDPTLMATFLNRGGTVHAVRGDYEAALADFRKAASLRPGRADPLINIAETLRKQSLHLMGEAAPNQAQGAVDEALDTIQAAIKLDPSRSVSYRLRGELLVMKSQPEQAIPDFRRSIELETDDLRKAESNQLLASAYEQTGKLTPAREALEEGVRLAPENAEYHWQLAQLLLKAGEMDAAIAQYGQALTSSGVVDKTVVNQGSTPVTLAGIYRARSLGAAALGLYRQAMQDYTRSLELEPAANILTRRGWAYLGQANQLALADFEEAVKLNPENGDAYTGRGYCRVLLGNVTGGVEDAETALNLLKPQIEREGASRWPLLFNVATIYAQAHRLALAQSKQPDSEQAKLAQDYATRAIATLESAASLAGEKNARAFAATVAAETALDSLRELPEFKTKFDPR